MSIHALLISTDLMALSSTEGAAAAAGATIQTVAPGKAIEAAVARPPRVAAIDLTAKVEDLPALVDRLRESSPGVAVIAYGPHVHEAKLQAAQDAGCDLVMSRGQFHRGFGEVLSRYASG